MTPVSPYLIPCRWTDFDQLGHVNNAVYLTYLEAGRDEFLAPCGIGAIEYVVRSVSIEFLAAISSEVTAVEYRAQVTAIGRTSIQLHEELHTPAGLSATAGTTLVLWDAERGASRVVNENERALLQARAREL